MDDVVAIIEATQWSKLISPPVFDDDPLEREEPFGAAPVGSKDIEAQRTFRSEIPAVEDVRVDFIAKIESSPPSMRGWLERRGSKRSRSLCTNPFAACGLSAAMKAQVSARSSSAWSVRQRDRISLLEAYSPRLTAARTASAISEVR